MGGGEGADYLNIIRGNRDSKNIGKHWSGEYGRRSNFFSNLPMCENNKYKTSGQPTNHSLLIGRSVFSSPRPWIEISNKIAQILPRVDAPNDENVGRGENGPKRAPCPGADGKNDCSRTLEVGREYVLLHVGGGFISILYFLRGRSGLYSCWHAVSFYWIPCKGGAVFPGYRPMRWREAAASSSIIWLRRHPSHLTNVSFRIHIAGCATRSCFPPLRFDRQLLLPLLSPTSFVAPERHRL